MWIFSLTIFCIMFFFRNWEYYHTHAHRCWSVSVVCWSIVLPFTAADLRTCATDSHHQYSTEEHCALPPRVIKPTWMHLGFFQTLLCFMYFNFFFLHRLLISFVVSISLHELSLWCQQRCHHELYTLARFF